MNDLLHTSPSLKKERIDTYFMEHAKLASTMSYCKRNLVGSVIVKDNRIISEGRNGTVESSDNCCEESYNGEFITKNSVVHAEANAILFAARHGISTLGCTIYITLSPCMECAKMIIQSGIKRVVYKDDYRDLSGIEFLKENNIIPVKLG